MATFNRSNMSHPAFAAKLKAAVVEAVRKSSPYSVGVAYVENSAGDRCLLVTAWPGRGFEVQDRESNDVTAEAKAALRDFHASKKAIPLMQIEFDSGPMTLWYLTMHGPLAGVSA